MTGCNALYGDLRLGDSFGKDNCAPQYGGLRQFARYHFEACSCQAVNNSCGEVASPFDRYQHGIHRHLHLSVPADVTQCLRYLLSGACDSRDELGLFGAAAFAGTTDRDSSDNGAKMVEDGRSYGLDTLFHFAL